MSDGYRAVWPPRLVRAALRLHPRRMIAMGFVRRANAARDAGRYQAAAALYEEALRLVPNDVPIRIQCGHMMKEAGDFDAAEQHYVTALRRAPADSDLALQLGHFYKIASRPDEAEASYRRALALRPGWAAAEHELAHLSASDLAAGTLDQLDLVVPELLPQRPVPPRTLRDGITILRLGASRERSHWRTLKLLRGVEAIRGYCVSAAPIVSLSIVLGGDEVHRSEPEAFEIPGERGGRRKYVFNAWIDCGRMPTGPQRIELRFTDSWRRVRVHRADVLVEPPLAEADFPESDALAAIDPADPRSIEQQIGDRPSMIRPARRSLLSTMPRRILVQRADQLGDLVCSVPAVRRLRELFPAARLIGLLTPANAPLARSLDLFDEIVVADFVEDSAERRRVMPLPAQKALRVELHRHDFDIAIDLGEGDGSRPLLLLSGARFLYGFKHRASPWLSAGFDCSAPDPIDRLETMAPSQKLVALVETLGIMARSQAAVAPISAPLPSLAAYGIRPGDGFLLLHGGARLAYSRWPHFAALARLLLERTDRKVVVLSDDIQPDPELAAISAHDPRLRLVSGRLPFEEFDALASSCAVFVGNDSGPKHLAALRGTQVVSLHMARLNWNEWGQELEGAIISRRVPCAGCAIAHEPEECGKGFTCIRAIRPEEVAATVLRLLDGDRGAHDRSDADLADGLARTGLPPRTTVRGGARVTDEQRE